jgi:hypothetical protein
MNPPARAIGVILNSFQDPVLRLPGHISSRTLKQVQGDSGRGPSSPTAGVHRFASIS